LTLANLEGRQKARGAPRRFQEPIERLERIGATPERRWEAAKNGNGNGKPQEKAQGSCVKCGSRDLELITWERNGKKRQAYKCRACKAWQPGK